MNQVLIRLRQKEFDKEEWKTNIHSRKYFYRNLIKSRMLIGKNVYDCGRLLGAKQRKVAYGDSWKIIDLKEWSYFLYRSSFFGINYSLALYFENGKVNKVELASE